MILDRRTGIGPHHLGIGKTRKFDGEGNPVFSVGPTVKGFGKDFQAAFGGGSFCVDGQSLIYVEQDRKSCWINCRGAHQKLCITESTLAAPWVTEGPDGKAWWSVLSRDGNHRIGLGSKSRILAGWYHSAI